MSDPLQQSSVGDHNVLTGDYSTVNITHGIKAEEIIGLFQARENDRAKIDELAAKLNLTREAFRGILRILKEDDVPVEQLAQKLELIAQQYLSMMNRLAALDPVDAEAQAYIDEAKKVLGRAASTADYDRADELLSKAEKAQEQSLRRVEALEREAHEAACRLRRSMAAIRAERGALSLTQLNYLQAAGHFREAAKLVSADDLTSKLDYLIREGDALATHGKERGGNAVLAQAIGTY
jgi:hypothetical protein